VFVCVPPLVVFKNVGCTESSMSRAIDVFCSPAISGTTTSEKEYESMVLRYRKERDAMEL
jgi:hypothetical protein